MVAGVLLHVIHYIVRTIHIGCIFEDKFTKFKSNIQTCFLFAGKTVRLNWPLFLYLHQYCQRKNHNKMLCTRRGRRRGRSTFSPFQLTIYSSVLLVFS